MTAPTQLLPILTPYSTLRDFLGTKFSQGGARSYLTGLDQQRLDAYQVYEQIYWNVPDTFKIIQRGSGARPIYIPTARTLINTMDRYVATGFDWMVDPLSAPDTELALAKAAFTQLFSRERFLSKFDANKLFGLIRGDWCWHILANPLKPAGSRISILPLDPGSFFKITHPDDVDRVIGVDIIEQITDGNDVRLKVQRYSKGPDPLNDPDGANQAIFSQLGIWKLDDWGDPKKKPLKVLSATALPAQITALPVYHLPNFETPGDPYGSSELRGFETVIAAINQSVSDEDLALALEGLGVYATDSGPPRDETTGKPTSWKLGPGRVIELKTGSSFNRVTGVKDLDPYQDHLAFLINSIKEASGATDAAAGKVDVAVAESGISLIMQLGPILASAAKKDRIVTDVHTQMFFDLARGWLSAYEQINLPTALVVPTLGSKLPPNISGALKDILSVVGVIPGLLPWAVRQIHELGFDMTPEEIAAASATPAASDPTAADPFAARADATLNGTTPATNGATANASTGA